MRPTWILIPLLLLLQSAWAAGLDYSDLVGRLTDLDRLALLPEKGERCALWSSYDRSSRYDASAGEYLNWDANVDGQRGAGWIRLEGERRVLAEMEGPGCLWRIWTADPREGQVGIYIDGKRTPAVELPFYAYFNREAFPFIFPSLVYDSAKGRNSYIPIPFQKSCRVLAEPGYGQYYHFTCTAFPRGTRVDSFTRALDPEQASALARMEKTLANCGENPAGERPDQVVEVREVELGPGEGTRIIYLTGPKTITSLRFKANLGGATEERLALRELALAIRWEDERQPSVWSPLGDFFGTAPGANRYRSLPMGIDEEGWWYSYWYMPFETSAHIELYNDGEQVREATFEITHAPLPEPIEQWGRFHAKWHLDAFLTEDPNRQIDWPVVLTQGRGRFCGMHLHVWNPGGGWWGEGDEKFFVDGEAFPSLFGTGSEDYFGYAWGNCETFEHAFHNQTLCENGNAGHLSVNRWHIADNVPFQTSFEGYIEKYFDNDRPTIFASTAYWYLAPGGEDPYGPVPVEDRLRSLNGAVANPKANEVFFTEPGEVILSCETADAKIHYTTDGSSVTEESALYTAPLAVAATLELRVRAFKERCYPSPEVAFDIVVSRYEQARDPGPVESGLIYRYYEGQWGKLPDFTLLTPMDAGTTDSFRTSPGLFKDHFGLVLEGYVRAATDGIYTFSIKSDDGSRLWIDGRQVADNDGIHGPVERGGKAALRAGLHAIRVAFFENEGDEMLEVSWESPGLEKEPIPAEALVYAASELEGMRR